MDIAKTTRDTLKLEPMEFEDLPDVCAMKFPPGKTVAYE